MGKERNKNSYSICITSNIESTNPYVRNLVSCLNTLNCYVECSKDLFFYPSDRFDILHIQWMEELLPNWKVEEFNQIREIGKILDLWKKNVKVVCTIHNIKPHKGNDSLNHLLYKSVLKRCDHLIFIGPAHISEFYNKYNLLNINYSIVYHHISQHSVVLKSNYFIGLLKRIIPKKVIFIPGKIRDTKERELIDCVSKVNKDKIIISPGYFYNQKISILGKRKYSIYSVLKYLTEGRVMLNRNFSWRLLSILIQISDLVFLSRLNYLNSGNLPLAFIHGKVIVGSDYGNIGFFANLLGNFTFGLNSCEEAIYAINQALDSDINMIGQMNYDFAYFNMNPNNIAARHFQVYSKVLNE